MSAGRPRVVDAGTLYSFAHQLYWDFRRLDEGTQRVWFDRAGYQESMQAIATEYETALTEADQSQRLMNRLYLERVAHDAASGTKRIPGEPDIVDALLLADSPERVRNICQDAHTTRTIEIQPGVFRQAQDWPNWPVPYGSLLPLYLSQYAEAFIAAKQDPRCPRSERESSRLKQLWFLSRALAGASFGVSARTAINLVGSTRPEEVFKESRMARPRRKRIKPRKT